MYHFKQFVCESDNFTFSIAAWPREVYAQDALSHWYESKASHSATYSPLWIFHFLSRYLCMLLKFWILQHLHVHALWKITHWKLFQLDKIKTLRVLAFHVNSRNDRSHTGLTVTTLSIHLEFGEVGLAIQHDNLHPQFTLTSTVTFTPTLIKTPKFIMLPRFHARLHIYHADMSGPEKI